MMRSQKIAILSLAAGLAAAAGVIGGTTDMRKIDGADISSYSCCDISWGYGTGSTATYTKTSLPSTVTTSGVFTVALSNSSSCYMNATNANAMKFGKSKAADSIPTITLTFDKQVESILVYACAYGTDSSVNLSVNGASQALTTNYDSSETVAVGSNENQLYGYRKYSYDIGAKSFSIGNGEVTKAKRALVSKIVLRLSD